MTTWDIGDRAVRLNNLAHEEDDPNRKLKLFQESLKLYKTYKRDSGGDTCYDEYIKDVRNQIDSLGGNGFEVNLENAGNVVSIVSGVVGIIAAIVAMVGSFQAHPPEEVHVGGDVSDDDSTTTFDYE